MPSSVAFRLAVLSVALVSLPASSALGQSQPFAAVETPRTWKVDVGGGVVRGFSVSGKDGDQANVTAWGSASYRDILYANGLDGIGWNAVKRDDFHAGAQLRPRFSAGEVDGMDRPGLGADAALYAFKRLPGNVVVGGRVQHDATGDDAGLEYYGSVGHQGVTRVGLLQTLAYMRGGDDKRARRYYGVTAQEAASSGYAAFAPSGGLSAAGAAALLAISVGDRFGLGAFVNYEQRLGDVQDSPLIDDDHVWRAGIIGVVRFNSGD
ncbi:MipA/OmpV family protein [Brevundimonas naejangsanensis]|uniref:MipA/OmpV family protein n=1 Tax=Brevundimonas naejangsanensis TaxID=588932 RepID=A0A494RS34_9CAUL|nr:MipA/OmpV family protein [Brevundimonas naejangsanensis]AYG96314.1 MipA/OmpV family protein [Brevundimonas naejangsanensis]